MLKLLLNLGSLTDAQALSLGNILTQATRAGDTGVVDWVNRAIEDAKLIGHLRAKDINTLERLERTYGSDFYNSGNGGTITVYA